MKIILFLGLLIISSFCYSQSDLHQLLRTFDEEPSTNKSQLILEGAKYEYVDISDSLRAELLMRLGIAHGMLGNFDSSIHYFNFSHTLAIHNQYLLKARDLSGIGNVMKHTGKSEEGLESFLKALELVENREDTESRLYEGTIIGNIAGLYYGLNDMGKAESYTTRALEIATTYNQQEGKAFSYVRLALIYNRLAKYDEALDFHKKATVLIELTDDYFLRNYNLVNLAKLHATRGNLPNALNIYYELADEKNADSEVRSMAMENAAKLEFGLENYSESISIASKLRLFAEKNQTLPTLVESIKWLHKSYQAKGDHETANRYINEYIVLKDSLINIESLKAVSELETKYESEKKEQEITQLKLQNQQSINQRNVYLFVSLVIALGLVFLVILVRSKTKSSKIILNSLNEKETLLKEIHHRVKNNLQVISSLLSLQSRYIEDKNAQEAVNEGQNRVKSMALIHQKLYQKENLAGVEAHDYIQNLTSALQSTYGIGVDDLEIKLDIDKMLIDVDTIIPMGLILNELISNAFKYAFPKKPKDGKLEIQLKESDSRLVLNVKDNGVGGALGNIENSNTFGIKMIKSLARKLEADVSFETRDGTVARLSISNYKLI